MKTIPTHVGVIMDGNRRWAKQRSLAAIAGHREGKNRIEPIVEHAAKKGIEFITFWAFSTENWKRGPLEVNMLLQVFREAIKDPMIKRLQKNGVKVNILGELESFPQDIVKGVSTIIEDSKENNKITANFALNYGGRAEILHAVNDILKEKKLSVTEEEFSSYLFTAGQPDPDFIIRTGGEQRLSGFLPWQSIYSELYFTETYWPDFTVEVFDTALEEYAQRSRRFGK